MYIHICVYIYIYIICVYTYIYIYIYVYTYSTYYVYHVIISYRSLDTRASADRKAGPVTGSWPPVVS